MDEDAPTPDTEEVHTATLEGSYEQLYKHIGTLETDLSQGLADIRTEIRNLRTLMFSPNGMLALLITVFAYLTRS